MNPGCHIPHRSTSIHGICNANIEVAPFVHETLLEFLQWMQSQGHCHPTDNGNGTRTTTTVMVAHNNFGFDAPMLLKECYRARRYDSHMEAVLRFLRCALFLDSPALRERGRT